MTVLPPQYLTLEHAKKWHKALWIILLMIMYVTMGSFVQQVMSEYAEMSITTNIRMHANLSDIYYPAITICNLNREGAGQKLHERVTYEASVFLQI